MNTEEIKSKLETFEYDFLRRDENLGKNIILLTLGGSYAYGTNTDSSDLDVRGIAVERVSNIIGLTSFQQFEDKETDTVIYGLKKIIKLLLNCNPNTIEMLGTKDEHVFVCNKYGKELRNNIDIFLSKKAIQSFGGYASQQLRRLQNSLVRDNYPSYEKEEHILNSINNQIATMNDRYQFFDDNNLKLYVDTSKRDSMIEEIYMDINFKHYPLRDFKNIYSEMSNVVRSYDKLTHRNNKKDSAHMYKHAMHLIRLLNMGTEILEGKGVNTYREADHEILMDIRNGYYSYEEIFEMVDKYVQQFDYASKNTVLNDNPDIEATNQLLIDIYKDVILNA
ncbi:MAG: nucleotidyltransferase domain-containing protein [Clostridium sp.]|nr:nucleotidyltransferase domain-containing protein [Clostridium sp.]